MAETRRVQRRRRALMPPPVRKTILVVHIITSVSWLGLTFADVTLAIVGISADTAAVQHAMFRAVGTIGDVLILPVAWTAYVTGLLLAVGTKWGLIRHTWVLTKFCITTLTVLLTTFSLVPGLQGLRDGADAAPVNQLVPVPGSEEMAIISASIVSSTLYTICVILSVTKPWGRTRWARTQ